MVVKKRNIKSKFYRIKKGWKTKSFWKDVLIYYSSKILYLKNNGIFVTMEKWDHLIILDACRYDVFVEEIKKRKLYNMGKLEYRISRGASTPEFLLENFSRGLFEDIVYITANPYVDLLLKGKFHKIIPVWNEGWDENLNTIHPKTVYEYTLDALSKYPDKRFIIHFMQPHYPFISLQKTGDTGIKNQREATLKGDTFWQDITIWDLMRKGEITLDQIISGYKDNLKIALDYVERLIEILPGRKVIMADHGEAFGEKLHPLLPIKVYGHYTGVRIEPLINMVCNRYPNT